MSKLHAYDTDIVAWADEQASLLRDFARRAPPASNRIDWDNIAEEIETVGRSETRAVMSAIRLVFVHLIKLAALPESPAAAHWRGEIVTWLGDIRQDVTPAMIVKIDCQSLWQRAVREATTMLSGDKLAVAAQLPVSCPFILNDLLDEHFDLSGAISTLTATRNLT